MNPKKYSLPALCILFMVNALTINGFAQAMQEKHACTIAWNQSRTVTGSGASSIRLLSFPGSALRQEYGLLPVFVKSFAFDPARDSVIPATLDNPVFEPYPYQELAGVKGLDNLSPDITLRQELAVTRKISSWLVSLLPLRRNQTTGQVERLVSFTLTLGMVQVTNPRVLKPATGYASHSVLSAGTWFKFAVGASGMYRLTYDDLKKAGVDVANIDPRNLRLFGNNGGMLPEANAASRADDLTENAIFVAGEADGRFNTGDYILFYGKSPDTWSYNKVDQLFHHQKNIYSDKSYYFLTVDQGLGKRLGSVVSTTLPSTYQATGFEDYAFYEKNGKNLISSGRIWWDDQVFDVTTTRDYSFSFPNIDQARPATVIADVAARSMVGNTSFVLSAQGAALTSIGIDAISGNFEDNYAIEQSGKGTFSTANPVIGVNLNFNRYSASAEGFLRYIEVNATRLLTMSGPQMSFRSARGTGSGNITEFTLNGNGQNLQVWDVSSGAGTLRVETSQSGANYIFRLPTDTLREFVAFDGTTFFTPDFTGRVENQDLHGTPVADYLIVCHPSFLDQAERLATFHRANSSLSVFITTPDKIYNEFSSGAQDITAIRDYVRMMYNKAEPGKEPKYLLLFGDASYDFKNRTQNNTNFVPAYESVESLSPTDSFVSDDYFGLMDANEGQSANGSLDIGVGRFPVSSAEQAKGVVDKVLQYCSQSDTVKNDWRNVVTFVADDQNEGGNLFIDDSEDLAKSVENLYPRYNIDKIYSDAYPMESTPGGNRYPEVNKVINKRVEKGSLIMNYVGHGGEVGWAHERILEVPDIQNWGNVANMPVFVTATCEFSRFDDPLRTSAGEWVLLNSHGGGIALFTTTRLTYAGTNKSLLVNFYNDAFKQTGGTYMKMGDLLMAAKANLGSSANIHAFVLLGDPAMQMAYPNLNIVTTSINGKAPVLIPDTLHALEEMTITGEVRNQTGQIASDFSGTVFPTVFDKSSEIWTRANQGPGGPVQFFLRKNPVYKGKVNVINGIFSFTFIVPRDIAYQYGVGKISYYARSPQTDANGSDLNIQVGGYNNQASHDTRGPKVALYLNNRSFISGGITDQHPLLLADVSDSSGVNTVGNGIGHDITAVLDNVTTNPMILNDYYVSDLDTYKSGSIEYPLSGLADGPHQITLKVWDVYNNSTDARLDFIVVSSGEFAFRHLLNYPNPMNDHTTFAWETNQVDQPVEIQILVYTLSGKIVKTLRTSFVAGGYREATIHWDGTQDDGRKISSGLYLYEAQMMIPDGTAKRLTSKLVVIR